MSDEEFASTLQAALLGGHVLSAHQDPETRRGIIETRTQVRAFETEESFDDALRQEATVSIDTISAALDDEGYDPSDETGRSNREREQDRKESRARSKYAEKKARRLVEEAQERERSQKLRKERKESAARHGFVPRPPSTDRVSMLGARLRVTRLQNRGLLPGVEPKSSLAASTAPAAPAVPVPDQDRQQRMVMFGLHDWS